MWLVATQNFQVVDSILASKNLAFYDLTESMTDSQLRLTMRHQASEVNRLFFDGWGKVQLILALFVVLLAWRARLGKFITASTFMMLFIAALLQFWVVPEIIQLGRIIDFLPRHQAPTETAFFWTLHHSYTGLDIAKFLLVLTLTALVLRKV